MAERLTQREIMDLAAKMQQSAAKMQQAVTPAVKPIPWFDLGAVTDENLELMVKGLRAWAPIADQAVVTIGAQHIGELFKEFQADVPGIRITPALTTSGIMGYCEHWGSEKHWDELAAAIRAAHEQLPESPVLLENEFSLRDYFQGRTTLNFMRFAALLPMLPRDVPYIWYPSAGGGGDKLERYMMVATLVQAILEPIHFAEHVSLFSKADAHRPKTYYAAARLQEIAAETVPMIYTQKWGEDWEYVPDALQEVAQRWPHKTCYIYMGRGPTGNWADSAIYYQQAMR
jgi:hypothetical protein